VHSRRSSGPWTPGSFACRHRRVDDHRGARLADRDHRHTAGRQPRQPIRQR
jgi:hypothetical protein